MPAFVAKYSQEQRDAFTSARLDRGLELRRISELAAAGELTTQDGRKLDPFRVPLSTITTEARRAHNRRTGKAVRALAAEPPRDAIEALRRRLVNAADIALADWEKQAKRDPKRADPERLRQIARAAREIAAMPGPTEPRPPKPGQKVDGVRHGSQTQPNGSLAGSILADARRSNGQAPTVPSTPDAHTQGTGDNDHATVTAAHDAQHSAPQHAQPGSRVAALAHQQ